MSRGTTVLPRSHPTTSVKITLKAVQPVRDLGPWAVQEKILRWMQAADLLNILQAGLSHVLSGVKRLPRAETYPLHGRVGRGQLVELQSAAMMRGS